MVRHTTDPDWVPYGPHGDVSQLEDDIDAMSDEELTFYRMMLIIDECHRRKARKTVMPE